MYVILFKETIIMNRKKSSPILIFTSLFLFFLPLFLLNSCKKENAGPSDGSFSPRKKDIRRTPVVTAIEKVMPSVVNLSTEKLVDRRRPLWMQLLEVSPENYRKSEPGYSIGTGTIIDPSGLILTSAHVVSRASRIRATLHNGRILNAEALFEDPENDIALLRISNTAEHFQPIRGTAPDDLMLGETTIAVGNPYGLDGTITAGVRSGIGRSITSGGKPVFTDLLQTDASVFPGSSGGPLINLDAKMIGMNIAVRRNAPGIGFAIPLPRIENTLAQWMIPDRSGSALLGIVPALRKDGTVCIRKIFPGSPAERAGLREGDVIRTFNRSGIRDDLLPLLQELLRVRPHETVVLETDSRKTVRITAEPLPESNEDLLIRFKLGISLENLTPPLAGSLHYPFDSGVIVSDPSPVLSGYGIKRGDMLVKLGNRIIHSMNDVARVLRDPEYPKIIPAYFLSLPEADGGNGALRETRIYFRRK